MCCITGIVLAMQGILRVSADLLKPGSVLISIKHWDFPRAFPTVISILAACLCGQAHPLLLQEPQTPAALSPENVAQTIIAAVTWKGVYCNSRRSAIVSLAYRRKCLHLCLQAITAEL